MRLPITLYEHVTGGITLILLTVVAAIVLAVALRGGHAERECYLYEKQASYVDGNGGPDGNEMVMFTDVYVPRKVECSE